MNDFEYDCKCKKDIARSAHNHVNARRGKCKLPHEYLSAKERKALNGEVKTYSLRVPLTIAQFITLPRDLKQEYLTWLQQTFHANDTMLAELWNTSTWSAGVYRKAAGVASMGRGRKSFPTQEQREAWNAWLHEEEQPETAPSGELYPGEFDSRDDDAIVEEPEKVAPAAETKPDGKAAAVEKKPPVADIQGFRVIWANVHSWEALYALATQFPFPCRPAKIRLDLV